jgi:hypothetical protein
MADKIEWGAGTVGPWAVAKKSSRKVTSSGVVICNAVLRNQGGPKHKAFLKEEEEAEANARAIAEVPAMVQVLRKAQTICQHIFADVLNANDDEDALMDEIYAVLARIDGEVGRG